MLWDVCGSTMEPLAGGQQLSYGDDAVKLPQQLVLICACSPHDMQSSPVRPARFTQLDEPLTLPNI